MATPSTSPRSAVAAFARDEEGVITIVALIFFVMMMLAGGVAIDFMRAETERAKLQYTLDRAVLAAASLTQETERDIVVKDYLRAAGLEGHPVSITGEGGPGSDFRRVTVEAQGSIDSLFLRMLGVDQLRIPASATAEERKSTIELVLVLDMSGSMDKPSGGASGETKMDALQEAANSFVEKVVSGREENTVVSIVPYGAQVDMGPTFGRYFPFSRWHTYSSCARFEVGDYRTTAIRDGEPLRQLASFQLWGFPATPSSPAVPNEGDRDGEVNARCLPTQARPLLWSSDVTAIETLINSLNPNGGTGTDVATKWAVALLDPSSRPRRDAMIRDGVLATTVRGVPASYDDTGTMKVLVLMTDGNIDEKEDIRASGLWNQDGTPKKSGIVAWRNDFAGLSQAQIHAAIDADVAVRKAHATAAERAGKIVYYVRDEARPTVFYRAYDGTDGRHWPPRYKEYSRADIGAGAYELDFGQLWAIKSYEHVKDAMAKDLPSAVRARYGNPREEYHSNVHGKGTPRTQDNLAAICSAAKDRGVLVFTIGFRVEGSGLTDMRDCASGAANFYDVQIKESLQAAFDQIARVVTQLTLTR